jgi:hypothetical protein
MTKMIEVFAGPKEIEISNAQLDAEAIKDTPYQGALPSAERTSGIKFAHENSAAWALLSNSIAQEEYLALKNAVAERVGIFQEKTPELEENDE